jgi:HD superfamily phosphodiesterase
MVENNHRKGIPTIQEAEAFLEEAGRLNPGPWVKHSIYAGKAAQLIAQHCEDIDPDTALVLGMLHDTGRRFGITGMRHVVDGYNFLMGKGFYRAAKICITHSFDGKDIKFAFGKYRI